MKKRLLVILLLAGLVAISWWYLYGDRFDVSAQLSLLEQRLEETVLQAENRVSAPPPLRAGSDAPSAHLTEPGVLSWTNAQRKEHGLSALTTNEALNAAAETKLQDMFAKQYFEHLSPDGIDPGKLAGQAGYIYVMVGENLALGNFKNDQELVQAWMDSPGHRANILEAKYEEIGIAVGQGTYEGRKTWIAVQEFGRPQAACPKPDETLGAKIMSDKQELDQLKIEAEQLKAEIEDSGKPRSRAEADAHNAEVDRYNALVKQINELVEQIQGEITVYNGGVQAYNLCASAS